MKWDKMSGGGGRNGLLASGAIQLTFVRERLYITF